MHLVEQLRIKRSDAHNHLLSRKRKLAELFTATACTGDCSLASKSQKYFQQLQAFQDANDLLKGRLFDESTLPARSRAFHQPNHVSTQAAQPDTTKPSKDLRRSKSPSNVDVVAHVRSSSRSPQPNNKTTALPNGQDDGLEANGLPPGDSDKEGGIRGSSLESQTTKPSTNVLDQNGFHDLLPSPPKPSNRRLDGPVTSERKDASSRTQSPPVVAPPLGADPQSSPASTNGPGSSNTPAPTTGSPTTSLGEDVSPASAVLDVKKPASHDAEHDAPPTPDHEIAHPVHKMSVSSVDIDVMDTDPSAAFESPIQSASLQTHLQRETSTKPKPPISINTQHHLGTTFRPQAITSGAFVETPAPITGTDTPRPQHSVSSASALDSSRRATRISSGALQKKSVSEILGETPRSATPHTGSPLSSSMRDVFQSGASQNNLTDREKKEKERSKLSTVVFAKPQRPVVESDTIEISGASQLDLHKASSQDRDYLYTLFESKAYSSKQGNLSHLIQHAHKTITTADYLVDYEYQAQCRVLKRLYQLQSADRWALRQRKRAEEPARPTSHWDFLLDHVRWMRTDFREERKWKLAAARGLAECCAEWVASTSEGRKRLQINVRSPMANGISEDTDVIMDDEVLVSSHSTPDLLPSGEDDSVSDSIADPRDLALSAAPAAIFSLGASEFNFMADRTPAFDKLINELPLYEPANIEPDLAKSNLAERLDARWKTDIVPVSRYATERLKVKDYKPPFKRSRYDYELEMSPSRKTIALPPRETNVGLFMPENKHIRDRIHPGHSFRPPSEYPMPTQSFFETRTSSQWTPAEDDELRKLVKDYSYNWSLISSCLTSRCLYTSSPDRRTPWECFERWVGLEGMPTDMAKTPYFKTYSGRIEAAGRLLQAQIQAQMEEAQRRAGPNAPISSRKRTTQPVRVERKRAQRHLAMLDAMRKLAKKRETMRQKQAHSSEVAAMRKASEVSQHTKPPLRTPAEFSAMKHEREQKMAKQHELYRQQLIAHQRAASAQQQRGPVSQVNGTLNERPQPPMSISRGAPNGVPVATPNGQLQVPNGMPRPHPSMLGAPNPPGMVGPKAMQAQMQASMRNGMGGSPQQIRMQQEQMIRQAQQNGNHSSPNVMHANMNNGQTSTFMTDVNGVNGQASPSAAMVGNSSSPRQGGIGALSSGHVPVLTQIAANIKQRHPNMTDEDIQRAASQQLTTWQQQATAAAAGQAPRPRVNQAALNAALGAANAAAHAGNLAAAQAAQAVAVANGGFPQGQTMMTTEQLQQYNQRMRMQQAQQHAARGMQGQMPMAGQSTSSPMVAMARPVSQHNNQQQGMSRSATPSQRSGSLTNVPTVATPNTNGSNTTPINGVQSGQGQQGSPTRPPSQHMMQT